MIYSLVGQSEILTGAGCAFLLNGHSTLGYICIVAGVVGALGRYGSNLGLLKQQIEESNDTSNEKIASILSEISKS